MMDAKAFLKDRLSDIFTKVKSVNIRYQYSESDDTHLIEVTPASEYNSNELYYQLERELLFDFNDLFFPSTILFITEGSLNQISIPDLAWMRGREEFSNVTSGCIDFSWEMDMKQTGVICAGENNYSLAA
ncbi:MAG: hypothetical protein AB2L24_02720 [Mangrovibacterium sp.]